MICFVTLFLGCVEAVNISYLFIMGAWEVEIFLSHSFGHPVLSVQEIIMLLDLAWEAYLTWSVNLYFGIGSWMQTVVYFDSLWSLRALHKQACDFGAISNKLSEFAIKWLFLQMKSWCNTFSMCHMACHVDLPANFWRVVNGSWVQVISKINLVEIFKSGVTYSKESSKDCEACDLKLLIDSCWRKPLCHNFLWESF